LLIARPKRSSIVKKRGIVNQWKSLFSRKFCDGSGNALALADRLDANVFIDAQQDWHLKKHGVLSKGKVSQHLERAFHRIRAGEYPPEMPSDASYRKELRQARKLAA
jgi:hypothetical protein